MDEQTIIERIYIGHASAYAYALSKGYEGTEDEFAQLCADLGIQVENLENLTVTVETLAPGSSATASYADGVLALGIPKGDQGDPAPQEEITTATDAWLAEHITNPSNPPLDTSLTSASSAAPAKTVGDALTAQSDRIDTASIKRNFQTSEFEVGSIGSDGKNANSGTQNFARTIGYIFVNKGDVFSNSSSVVTPRVFIYNTEKVLDSTDPYTGWIGTSKYVVPHDGFIRLVYKNVSSGAAIDNVSTIVSSALLQRNATAEIADLNNKIIDANHLVYNEIADSHKNLFDNTKYVTGAIKSDGSFDPSYTDWMTSDYILVNSSNHYELYNFALKTKRTSNVTVSIFDSKKIRLNTISVRNTTPDNVTIFNYLANYTFPDDALYIKISLQKVYSNALMLVVSTYIPLVYSPYQQKNYYNSNFGRGTTVFSFGKQGYNTLDKYTGLPIYPHSSIVSFIAALNEGFDGIWFAVLYTSDGDPVLCHNDDISNMAVNADGTPLSSPYKISEHTYSELAELDFGLPYGSIYEGTKILTLEEGIQFSKHYGVNIGIEIESGESEQRYIDIANLVKSYGMDRNVSIFSYNASNLETVSEMLPYATLYLYGGSTSAEAITSATNAAPLITQLNEVYLLFTPFTLDLTQEAITSIKGMGVKIAYTNPNSEPDTVIDFFEQEKNNYVSMVISRIIPAWKVLRDNVVDNLVT